MTREVAREWLPLLQALVDGKTIQVMTNAGWRDRDCLLTHLSPSEHRIKPEPRRWWSVEFRDGSFSSNMTTEAQAQKFATCYPDAKVIEVIEVLR